jgi:hypothetical protein
MFCHCFRQCGNIDTYEHSKPLLLVSQNAQHLGKVKLFLYRPWRALGLREFEAPTFSDIRLIDGNKIVSPTRRPLFTPRKIPGTHFCYRLSRIQAHNARLEGLGKVK